MNKFQDILLFTRVAELGSFTAAARDFGVSVSSVTKAVARLEGNLGVRLFNRTTRRLGLTDDGRDFHNRCTRVLQDLEEAETLLRDANDCPKGTVRVSLPFSFGRLTVIPCLPEFYKIYPDINLEIYFSDRWTDLVKEGFDLAVRTGRLSDSSLVTRLLVRGPLRTVASRAYLSRFGEPQIPEDLLAHNCIIGRFGPQWPFRDHDGGTLTVSVGGKLSIYNGDVLREAVVAGLGIAQSTWWLFRKDLEAGTVVPILEDFAIEGDPISIIYPANRRLPAKVRAVIDFLVTITREERQRLQDGSALEPIEFSEAITKSGQTL